MPRDSSNKLMGKIVYLIRRGSFNSTLLGGGIVNGIANDWLESSEAVAIDQIA